MSTAKSLGEFTAGVVVLLGAMLLIGLLFAFPIMWLWNWLMPLIFGLPTITVWQAFGLKVLLAVLLPTPTTVSGS